MGINLAVLATGLVDIYNRGTFLPSDKKKCDCARDVVVDFCYKMDIDPHVREQLLNYVWATERFGPFGHEFERSVKKAKDYEDWRLIEEYLLMNKALSQSNN